MYSLTEFVTPMSINCQLISALAPCDLLSAFLQSLFQKSQFGVFNEERGESKREREAEIFLLSAAIFYL